MCAQHILIAIAEMAAAPSLVSVMLIALTVLMERSAAGDAYSRYDNVSSDLVMIGAVLPIHKSLNGICGSINSLGIIYSEVIAYVVKTINNRTNFVPGVKFGFRIHDSCSSINTALDETLDLLTLKTSKQELGISAMIGGSSSAITIPIAQLLGLFRIPLISFSATNPILSDKTQFKYFLRTVPSDLYQSMALNDIVSYFNWTYVAAIQSGDIYGRDGVKTFIEIYKNDTVGRCIAGAPIEIPYPGATVEDYDKAVEELMQPYMINATVVVAFAQAETLNGLLDAIERRKAKDPTFTKNFVWVGTDAWSDVLNTQRLRTARNLVGFVVEEINNDYFKAYFTSLHISNHTDNPWFGEYWEYYFNCSLNGTNTSRQCDTAHQSLATDYNGDILYLAHAIDAVYTIAYGVQALQRRVCNGKPGLCNAAYSKGRLNISTLDGVLLFQHLLNVNFSRDTNGSVLFNQNGDINPAVYTVENLQESKVNNIGKWASNQLPALNLLTPVVWNQINGRIQSICSAPCNSGEYTVPVAGQSSCCWTCSPCTGTNPYSNGKSCQHCVVGTKANRNKDGCTPIEINYDYFSNLSTNPSSVIAITIASLGIVTTTIVGCVMLLNANHRVVMASSRELLALLFVGLFLCYFMPFVFIAAPSPVFCAIRRFGIGFSFSACFIPILVRVIRIHRIFNRQVSTTTPKFTSPLSQVIFALILLFIQVIILTLWLGLERPNVKVIYSAQSGEVRCSENPYMGLSITLGYNAVVLLLTFFFAFRTRKVPESFNESKFISITASTLVVIWTAFILIYFGTASLGYAFMTGSQVICIVFSATAVLGCFLIPKVYTIVSNKWKEYHVSSADVTPQPADCVPGTCSYNSQRGKITIGLPAEDGAPGTSSCYAQRGNADTGLLPSSFMANKNTAVPEMLKQLRVPCP